MALVENNIVKMEWDKDGWLQKKSGLFCFASKEYDSTTKGKKVTVFFRGQSAFLWADNAHKADEDLWTAEDLKGYIKREGCDDDFPLYYEQYVAVVDEGEDFCKPNILEEYGITAYADDILARLKDIRGFSELTDMQF